VSRSAGSLPVDLDRLRREFPDLTDEDVSAYVEVTRRILAAPPEGRGGVTRDTVAGARAARAKAGRGDALSPEETLLARYLGAVEKMQRKGGAPRP
jgi:hypothetical protein